MSDEESIDRSEETILITFEEFKEIVENIKLFIKGEIEFDQIQDVERLETLGNDTFNEYINQINEESLIITVVSLLCFKGHDRDMYELINGDLRLLNELSDYCVKECIDFPFHKITTYEHLNNVSLYSSILKHNANNLPDAFIEHYGNLTDTYQYIYWQTLIDLNKDIYLRFINTYSIDITAWPKFIQTQGENRSNRFKEENGFTDNLSIEKIIDCTRNILKKNIYDEEIKCDSTNDLLDLLIKYMNNIENVQRVIFDIGIFEYLTIAETLEWKNRFLSMNDKFFNDQFTLPYLTHFISITNKTFIDVFEDELCDIAGTIVSLWEKDVSSDDFIVSGQILQRYVEKNPDKYENVMKYLINYYENILDFKPDLTEMDIREIIFKE